MHLPCHAVVLEHYIFSSTHLQGKVMPALPSPARLSRLRKWRRWLAFLTKLKVMLLQLDSSLRWPPEDLLKTTHLQIFHLLTVAGLIAVADAWEHCRTQTGQHVSPDILQSSNMCLSDRGSRA